MKKNNYPKYEQTVYTTIINGLKIVCIPNDKLNQTEVSLLVNYGATDIDFKYNDKVYTSKLGSAHFIEHKVFELSDSTDAFTKLSALGADANAYTTYDETGYTFSTSENLEKCFEVFFEFLFTNTLNDKSINREKGIIVEELMMYLDRPNYIVQNTLLQLMYKDIYIKEPILGTEESINECNEENLSTIFNAFYNINNMTLNISGKIDIDNIEKFLENLLNKYKFEEFNTKKIYKEESNKVYKQNDEVSIDSDVNYVALGIKLNPIKDNLDKYDLIIDAYNFMLFSKSTFKINNLIEKEVMFNNFSYHAVLNQYYSFIEFVAISDSKDELVKELKSSILNFENNFIEEDLELFKKISYSNFIYSLDNLDDLCYEVSYANANGYDFFEYNELLNNLTKEDLIKFSKEIKEDNISILTTKKI